MKNYVAIGVLSPAFLFGCTKQDQPTVDHDSEPRVVKPAYKYPGYLTSHEIATPDDLYLARLLEPLINDDSPRNWLIFNDVKKHLGDWITPYVDAERIAALIAESLPVDGQEALKSVDDLVADCAKVLHVSKPVVLIRESPRPVAYSTQTADNDFLVLTSGLLNLYDDRPEELRFVVGRELIHLKRRNHKLKKAAFAIIALLQQVDTKVIPVAVQQVLPTLGLGWLFSWSRETEITADRGGLLCCQDPQVAYNAMLRQLSGLGARSSWLDPNHKDFNADAAVREFRSWQEKPFVEFVLRVKKVSRESPFIPERVAALKLWAESERYRQILARSTQTANPGDNQLVIIKTIKAAELAPQGSTVDPYVIVFDGQKKLFQTTAVKSTRAATWTEIEHPCGCNDRQPIFFEIWDRYRVKGDRFVGGFVIYPINPKNDPKEGRTTYIAKIDWNWKQRTDTTRSGLAEVEVEFGKRAED